jgi:uncharacterized protein DUF2878
VSAALVNYALYQAGWFACVLGAAWGRPLLGTLLGILAVLAHVALARRRRDALVLALTTAAIGLVVDTVQIALGTLRFDVGTIAPWLPPPWLVVVWAQFAMTFHFGLGWLLGRPGRAALVGAIGGPLAFVAGQRLGVVTLHPEVWPSLVSLAATWSLAIPAAVAIAERQRGRHGIADYRWPRARSA